MKYLRLIFIHVLALFLSIQISVAQEKMLENFSYGEVSLEDLQMTVYEQDTSAEAVILVDEGLVGYDRIKKRFYLIYHAQIKILDPAGFDWADLSISYRGKKSLTELKGGTYNLVDGTIETTEVGEAQIQKENEVDDIITSTVTFPNVKVGSVIDYQYKKFSESPMAFLPWYFQTRIPVRRSKFYMLFPNSKRLKPRIYGYTPLKSYDKAWLKQGHFFEMENIPAFREEEYVKNPDDHYSKVVFEYVSNLADSWVELREFILNVKGFGATLEKLNRIKKIYPEERNWGNTEEDLKEIHSYIANHFEWNGRLGLIFNDNPKKIWGSTEASASDINLFLLMFLRKAGFTADPVFLSTINHGLINPDFPTFRQFNYVVIRVMINYKPVLVDATSKLRPFNVLPQYCLNDRGMVLGAGPIEWVPMNVNGERSVQSFSVNLEIDEEDELVGSGTANYSNSAASVLRTFFANADEQKKKSRFKSQNPYLFLEELTYEGTKEAYGPVRSAFKFNTEGKVDAIGNRLFLSPIVIKEVKNNPFKATIRTLPVEFTTPLNKRYFFNLSIPEGYEVEDMPKPVNFVLPNGAGSYKYICQQTGSKIQVMVRFNINKLMFGPSEYPDFRELFNLIVAKQEEKIVLKKL